MLTQNRLKRTINNGKLALGLMSVLPVPAMVAMVGAAGYDFIILDPERGGIGPGLLEDLIRAAECAGIAALVRVPPSAPDALSRALNAGAQGVVVRVKSREEAEAVVRGSRFPPRGERSLDEGRLTGFGRMPPSEFVTRANREVTVCVSIEDRAAVEALDSIVTVDGLDLVLEDGLALSLSYGQPGRQEHPEVQAAIRSVGATCLRHGVSYCARPRLPGESERWLREGAAALLLGEDRGLVFRSLQAHLENVRLELTSQ
ncbi:HpcH/HpaI aldolase family protein [Pyxidicoccus sp. 3LG]